MIKYNIYGIGAALVDSEVKVSDRFLASQKIDKGIMTLVDERRQRDLLDALKNDDANLIRKCGGSVCNSIVAAASLGSRTFFSGRVADDSDGYLYINDLNKAGVAFHSAGQDPGTTGKCLVMITEDAERTMNTYLGVSEALSEKEIDFNALQNSEWLYIEGYLVTNDDRKRMIKKVVDFARSKSVKIAISLSDPFVVSVYGDALREVIDGGVDLIFCNKDEALRFTNTSLLETALVELKNFSKTIAITDGKNGAVTFDGKLVSVSEGIAVNAIDTNGAGDMFAGAFLYAITSGRDYSWAANLANSCASKLVERFGPRLGINELFAIKEKFDI